MYLVGLDIDSRAYFTAATCGISSYIPLSVNTPSELKLNKLINLIFKRYHNNIKIEQNLT
jgi:hypothetical protein